ncbi:MarR family transcriptional regulator [Pseudonocardia sp. GCM10023141]|uniref:MarR family transcriptional regulator n=1 Tax=Pseudonocardia sp. GCM10023141 TaxID=3252653 RepID=UPI00362350C7
MTEPRLLVLHILRLRGLAAGAAIAGGTGLPAAQVTGLLAELVDAGLVKERGGRLPGFALTPEGRAAHAAGIGEDLSPAERADVETGYSGFLPLNTTFKQLCTDWQLRGPEEPNDHTDAGYDAAVVERLATLHVAVAPVLAGVRVERFDGYPPRFAAALRRVQDGDRTAFARPLADSYHDAWMELHEDFLLSLGRTREAADGH